MKELISVEKIKTDKGVGFIINNYLTIFTLDKSIWMDSTELNYQEAYVLLRKLKRQVEESRKWDFTPQDVFDPTVSMPGTIEINRLPYSMVGWGILTPWKELSRLEYKDIKITSREVQPIEK
jgi:hypothetical protein